MLRLTNEQQVKLAMAGLIGFFLSAGAVETYGGILTLRGTGAYEAIPLQARTGFASTYFLMALMCFGTAGSICSSLCSSPKFKFFDNKVETQIDTSKTLLLDTPASQEEPNFQISQ